MKPTTRYIGVSLVFLLVAALACSFLQPTNPPAASVLIPLPTGSQSATPFTMILTQDELNSVANKALTSQPQLPVQDIKIELQNGQATISGTAQQAGISVPLKMVLTLAPDQQGGLIFLIVSADLGPLPMPNVFLNPISDQLNQALIEQLGPKLNTIYIENISITPGTLMISGHSR